VSGLVVLADVPLGYGSAQIVRLTETLSRLLNEPALIIAPKGDDAAQKIATSAGVGLTQLSTGAPFGNVRFDIEFCLQAAREADRLAPRWLVQAAFLGAPALLRLRHRPQHCIYYGYEHTDGMLPWVERVFAGLRGRFDLAIFPEPHRAALEAARLGLGNTPILVLLNSVIPLAPVMSSEMRNNRFVYAGLIDPHRTYGDAMLGGPFDELPIDIFGRLEGFDNPAGVVASLGSRGTNVRYHGNRPADAEYHREIAAAAAAIVAWVPLTESTFFACPNKFFEAVALGVPPITLPHPQTTLIVRQFNCGWVADGFGTDALQKALLKAQQTFGTPQHQLLVDRCIHHAQPHLSWAAQEKKLERVVGTLR
jgi:glycosyltransferase involved in cell wall biosynthesis